MKHGKTKKKGAAFFSEINPIEREVTEIPDKERKLIPFPLSINTNMIPNPLPAKTSFFTRFLIFITSVEMNPGIPHSNVPPEINTIAYRKDIG